MGFLENIAGEVLGGGQNNDLLSHVMGMINNQPGGLGGLVQTLKNNGLGDAVSSWVGTGENQAVSGDQIHSALGSQVIQDLAQKAGLSPELVTSQLANLLPGVINHLTPNGHIPQGLETIGMDLLKGFFSHGAGA